MKVKHRLLNFENKIIYQNDDWFSFSLDSVLLANFISIRKNDKLIMDLCTGNAVIPMLLTYRTNALIYGIEIQKCIYDLGVQSIVENNFSDKINLINDDVKNIFSLFECGSFDIVICNPPYFKLGNDKVLNYNYVKSVARHEILINLEDIVKTASFLLKNGGNFGLVIPENRLIEIINLMQKYRIEPKKMQLVYPKYGSNCNLILIEGNKNGKSGLRILNPLYVHEENGDYTQLVKSFFQE